MFKFRVVLLVWITLLSLSTTVNAQKNVEIDGYVIDAKGKPVQGAKIFWMYEPKEPSIDGLITGWKSFEDGYFGFTAEWKFKKNIRILIEAPAQNKCFNPVNFTDIKSKYLSSFESILITRYKSQISLGKITRYIQFGNVNINLQNEPNSFIQKIKNRLVYLRVKDSEGDIISDGTINPAYSENTRRLEFCLPKGEWYLELYEREMKTINIQPQKVVIDSQSPTININITE